MEEAVIPQRSSWEGMNSEMLIPLKLFVLPPCKSGSQLYDTLGAIICYGNRCYIIPIDPISGGCVDDNELYSQAGT